MVEYVIRFLCFGGGMMAGVVIGLFLAAICRANDIINDYIETTEDEYSDEIVDGEIEDLLNGIIEDE